MKGRILLASGLVQCAVVASSASADRPIPPPLSEIEPPAPDLAEVIEDRDWALVLGKALFWESRRH